MAKRAKLEVKLSVEYIPMPKEHVEAWRAGVFLLLQFMKEASRESVGVGLSRDERRTGNALFPLAHITEGKRTSTAGGLYAWVIGHDGSAHRMALADWRV